VQYENDLHRRGIYIGRNDRIDVSLGEYLNSYPERENLKIMFLR